MIETVAQLINESKEISLEKIKKDDTDINHRPTIGNIFEGLTSEILENSIFKGLDLKVVRQSFIYNNENEMSKEIDCMLVVGKGKKINFTSQYKYHISQVIAVIQVKKKLYANDIIDSHNNLHSVFKISHARKLDDGEMSLFYDAYRLLNSKLPPKYQDLQNHTAREQLTYSTLLSEAYLPVRIVFGYYGYKSEFELREGLTSKIERLLEERRSKEDLLYGFSPLTFPNLIICDEINIIKNTGMPFGIPFDNEEYFYWKILTTSKENSIKNFLELIWTKLSYKFQISSEIFGDDFSLEQSHPFISCKNTPYKDNLHGWELYYHELSKDQLETKLTSLPWEPVEIDEHKQIILWILGESGSLDINKNSDFNSYIEHNGLNKEKIISELVDSKLVYIDNDNMILLTDFLHTITTPEGKIYAGENKNGEMEQFLINYLDSQNK